MKFIVIEGLDGSGKSTQLKLLIDYLTGKKYNIKYLHFPRTDTPFYGDLIARFLRGELGDIENVNPYLVALIYAGDRQDASGMIKDWLKENCVVIADRYMYSNIAFQCAKLNAWDEKEKLAAWIKTFEYQHNGIPVPDLNLFLNVPLRFTIRNLSGERKGEDRKYLKGAKDIHEESIDFQKKVQEIYLWQVEQNEDFDIIDCSDGYEGILSPEQISERIVRKCEDIGL
jgi:dTMP kinase